MNTIGPLNLVCLLSLGVALWAAVQIIYAGRSTADDALRIILQIVSGLLVLLAVLGLIIALTGPLAIALLILGLIIGSESLVVYFRLERQAVLRYLAVAAERGLPLPTAARAYALERGDLFGRAGLLLAQALERGASLPQALRLSGHRFGLAPRLALGVGDELQCLPRTLRAAVQHEDVVRAAMRSWYERLAYVMVAFTGTLLVTSFLVVKIIPVLEKMCAEFGANPPATLSWFSLDFPGGPQGDLQMFALLALLVISLLALHALLLLAVFEVWSRSWPLIGRASLPYDKALVLRALGWGLANGAAVPEIVDCLARHTPTGILQRRLLETAQRIRLGTPWLSAFQASRLLSSADGMVLAAAERVGNLAWACELRASSQLKRLEIRLRAVLSIVFPLLLVALGGYVLLMAVAMFASLIQILQFSGQF
ncbi:MAG: type II secretion system F family protein [Pirellulales bacterium]